MEEFRKKTIEFITATLYEILTKDEKYQRFLSGLRTKKGIPAKLESRLTMDDEEKVVGFKYWDKEFPWIHKVYCFCDKRIKNIMDEEYFRYNPKDYKKFIELLRQKPNNDTSYFLDTSLFLGWGRSAISTTHEINDNNDNIQRIIKLIELCQFFCYGLYFLNHRLNNFIIQNKFGPMYKSDKDNEKEKPLKEDMPYIETVKDQLESLENERFNCIQELEYFYDTMGAILNSEHPILLTKIEKLWRL
jgi:hypothetical protein